MEQFLYQKYDNLSELHAMDEVKIPLYISENLKHVLRPYQKEGLKRYLHFSKKNPSRKEHVLFNMATGAGKTLMMAAFILEKYKQGERNFIFMVNRDNIITKTRDNLLNSSSQKYLFAEKIVISGEQVEIREVSDFSDSSSTSINLHFTTIQKLHQDLQSPRENRLSFEQFEETSIVILADEAHHLNSGLKKKEKGENATWTDTINEIQNRSPKSSILELTATIDLSQKEIANKYRNLLLYKYDLKNFRLDRFSKDVMIHQVDSEVENRMLHAIVISQYRKKVASEHGIFLKPVILFKSKDKAGNKINLGIFNDLLELLGASQLAEVRQVALEGILKQAMEFFEKQGIDYSSLAQELKEDFCPERLVLIDSGNKDPEKMRILNTMENKNNEIRAIFAVDMLNEGWDVLNLFDIVRLYDTRDGNTDRNGNYKPGATTISEMQLIGRGARYFPFVVGGNYSEKYERKFDGQEHKELRVLEQLHYHSKSNSRYIGELKQALTQAGIYDETTNEVEIRLKPEFKKSRTYTNGVIYVNEQRFKSKRLREGIAADIFNTSEQENQYVYLPTRFEIVLPTKQTSETAIFLEDNRSFALDTKTELFTVGNGNYGFTKNVIRKALNRHKSFTFRSLEKSFIGLQTMDGFINELLKIELEVTGQLAEGRKTLSFSQGEKLYILKELLEYIDETCISTEEVFYGTTEFFPKPISELFNDVIRRRYKLKGEDAQEGKSQINEGGKYQLDLSNRAWYAYDDNYGTSEEKSVVKELDLLMSELEEKWTDIYLLRNEKAVKIYDFQEGRGFEPDFLLFANDKVLGNISWQLFIEPKGGQFFVEESQSFAEGKEGWKERFLYQITEKSNAKTLVENDRYRIVGMPFYNEQHTKQQFVSQLRKL